MNILEQIIKEITKNKIYKVVFSGDSLTSADWIHPNFREIVEYVVKEELIKKLNNWQTPSWNLRFINSGLDGATSKDILKNLDNHIISYKPQLVILTIGINDIWNNIDENNYYLNLFNILDVFKEQSIKVVFSASPATNNPDINKKFQSFINISNTKLRVLPDIYIDLFTEFKKQKIEKFFTCISDGNEEIGLKKGEKDFLHPNILGNAYIAQILLKHIFQINFIPERYLKDLEKGMMHPKY